MGTRRVVVLAGPVHTALPGDRVRGGAHLRVGKSCRGEGRPGVGPGGLRGSLGPGQPPGRGARALRAPRQHEIGLARGDERGPEPHGLQPGTALAVHAHPGYLGAQPRRERCDPRHVPAGAAAVAQHHVVHPHGPGQDRREVTGQPPQHHRAQAGHVHAGEPAPGGTDGSTARRDDDGRAGGHVRQPTGRGADRPGAPRRLAHESEGAQRARTAGRSALPAAVRGSASTRISRSGRAGRGSSSRAAARTATRGS